jgi:dephospho-CoA kinase
MGKNTVLKIGITGGIGSGKTTVCKIFQTFGIPIYYADDRAKAIMVENKTVIRAIKKLFGEAAYLADGSLNRAHISDISFSNPLILNQLNAIVHPAVRRDGEVWHNRFKKVPYTLKEAALLFESGNFKTLDKIIVVSAPQELRLERALLRGGISREQLEKRMAAQMPEAEKIKLADFVINNDGTESLIPQVLRIHQALLSFAAV